MTFLETIDRHGRFGEWMASAAMFAIGVILALPGDTMRFSEWWGLYNLGFREVSIGCFASSIGAYRMVVLYINGAWRRTPVLRGVGAAIGVCFFATLAIMSAWSYLDGSVNAPDMNAAFYAIFAVADFRGCHRAGIDHHGTKLAA